MSSSTEWSDAQLCLLINERKQRNSEYHATPNKKKRAFWDDVANKLNEQENTNYFLGGNCHKKFLNPTKAFNVSSPAWFYVESHYSIMSLANLLIDILDGKKI